MVDEKASGVVYTLPKANITSEDQPFQNEASLSTIDFQGLR